jgi:hypothetical protein
MDDVKYNEILAYLRWKQFPPGIQSAQKGNFRVRMEQYKLHTELLSTASKTEILVRMKNGKEGTKNSWKILPKRSMLGDILKRYHLKEDDRVPAHVGRDRMCIEIFETYWWPGGATKDIQDYCRSCEDCSKTTPSLFKPPLQAIIAKHRRERCQFDLIELPIERETNFRYILNVINCHTKFAWSFPLKRKKVWKRI